MKTSNQTLFTLAVLLLAFLLRRTYGVAAPGVKGHAEVTIKAEWRHDSREPIPRSHIGAKAGTDYKGDGLAVIPTEGGARLRCVFQRLEGEATREGLWLTSTASTSTSDRFRVVAEGVGRDTIVPLPNTGTVSIDGELARFTRPALVEEYTVSVDGVQQDFVVLERPVGSGELAVRLAVSGASLEPAADGVQLVLENSGRKIAYSRLRVTDATGNELSARMEVQNNSVLRTPHSELSLAVVVTDAAAVYPIRIDPTFSDANWISTGGFPGANGEVRAAAVDGSGNLYIGGGFTNVGDIFANRVAKWNGSTWSALGSGMNSTVYALTVSGSDLYAGGAFTTADGTSVSYIAKWNGSSWSALGSGMDNAVYALAISGNDLYAGGLFTIATNSGVAVTVNRIAKWNGSGWSALGAGMNAAAVLALAVSGNDLYAGGTFTTAGGTAATNVAKWNGSTWSALGTGLNEQVWALAVSGSDLYAGGWFTMAGGTAAANVAKWNGSSWSALGSGMGGGGGTPYVFALGISGSDLYVGGRFTTAGGTEANCIAKWNGSSWSALASGMERGFGITSVYALAVSGGNVYAGGRFTTAGGTAANYIAKWDESNWSALGAGFDSSVLAMIVSGSDLYVGGAFTTAGGTPANSIAKWDGSSWSPLGSGIGGGNGLPWVYALAVSGSNVYAGGRFTTAGGTAANHIAKWNGSNWSALGSGIDGNGYVEALAVSGSNLYAGGAFTTAGGVSIGYGIAKWNGVSWSALGSGMNAFVYALAVSGSDLYAGGDFETAGGIPASSIAKWNGSNWSVLGSGMDGPVQALVVSDSNLYAGGYFRTAGGSAATNIAKWDGSSWSALGPGMNGGVLSLAVSGNDLYAGGDFTTAGGSAAIRIAKWNGNSWSALGSGMNEVVGVLTVLGNNLYAGGNFTTAGGKVSPFAARARISFTPDQLVLKVGFPSANTNTLTFSGVPGYPYLVQFATNLTESPWSTLSTNFPAADGLGTALDPAATDPQKFYRVGVQD